MRLRWMETCETRSIPPQNCNPNQNILRHSSHVIVKHAHTQTDRQTDRQPASQTARQTDRQTNIQIRASSQKHQSKTAHLPRESAKLWPGTWNGTSYTSIDPKQQQRMFPPRSCAIQNSWNCLAHSCLLFYSFITSTVQIRGNKRDAPTHPGIHTEWRSLIFNRVQNWYKLFSLENNSAQPEPRGTSQS